MWDQNTVGEQRSSKLKINTISLQYTHTVSSSFRYSYHCRVEQLQSIDAISKLLLTNTKMITTIKIQIQLIMFSLNGKQIIEITDRVAESVEQDQTTRMCRLILRYSHRQIQVCSLTA